MRGVSRLLRKSPKPVEFGTGDLLRLTYPEREISTGGAYANHGPTHFAVANERGGVTATGPTYGCF